MSRVLFDSPMTEVSVTPLEYVGAMGHSQTQAVQTQAVQTQAVQTHTESDPLNILRAAGFDFEVLHEGPGRQCAVCGATGAIAA